MQKKTQKPKIPDAADDKEQSERFIEAVRTHDADETGNSLEDSFKKIVSPKRRDDQSRQDD